MSNPESENETTPVIYVTGFGPFGNHVENVSQKVVEKLATLNIESELNVKLVTEILDVAYQNVLHNVPTKWKILHPKLVVHVGVSELTRDVLLEKQSFNNDYVQRDVTLCQPDSPQCIQGNPHTLETLLDLEKVITEMECDGSSFLKCSISHDPGRYLCGFVYYLSLSIDPSRSLFIHVPAVKKLYEDHEEAINELTLIISRILKSLYKQILERESANLVLKMTQNAL